MAKLVIITHPDINNSTINRSWKEALKGFPNDYVIHELYEKYPSLEFDIQAEQALWSAFDEIILQFPLHWFSTPFALKKYIDEVFTYGWAFGPQGTSLAGKKVSFAVSTGGPKESYDSNQSISVQSLLNDFRLSFEYCGCVIGQSHIFYGAMSNPSQQMILDNANEYSSTFLESVVE